jgi:hypothetical protein
MTENIGSNPPWEPAQPSATAVARDQAATVGRSVGEAGSHVAQTAADQAREVVSETRRQARDLFGEATGQAREQVSAQQQKAARQLRTVSDELHEMAAKGGQSGLATEVAQQAAERLHGAASWLEQREPADLLQAFRDFARRRPGTFLVGAALAGLAAGRLTRGMTDAARSGGQRSAGRREAQEGAMGEMPYAAAVPPPSPDLTAPMPAYPSDTVPGTATTTSPVAPGATAEAAPYYPAGGVPSPGAVGPDDETAAAPVFDDLPDSGSHTYRPGQQP